MSSSSWQMLSKKKHHWDWWWNNYKILTCSTGWWQRWRWGLCTLCTCCGCRTWSRISTRCRSSSPPVASSPWSPPRRRSLRWSSWTSSTAWGNTRSETWPRWRQERRSSFWKIIHQKIFQQNEFFTCTEESRAHSRLVIYDQWHGILSKFPLLSWLVWKRQTLVNFVVKVRFLIVHKTQLKEIILNEGVTRFKWAQNVFMIKLETWKQYRRY